MSEQTANSGKSLMQVLRETAPVQLAELPVLQQRFTGLLQKTRGLDQNTASMVFEQERYHFLRLVQQNNELRQCETMSLYGCFMDCALNGLSFDPSKKLAYIIPGNVNIGPKDQPMWVKRATMTATPYGELAIRQMQGQILHADNPIVVYEGDTFEPYERDGVKGVNYQMNINHTNVIVACFIRLVRPDGSTDYFWLLKANWERLAKYSEKKNKGKTNELYTSNGGQIDPGFLEAKTLKHAFRSMPKVNPAGFYTKLEEEEHKDEIDPEDIYGFKPDQPQLPANNAGPHVAHAAQVAQVVQVAAEVAQGPGPGLSDQAKAAILNATAEGEPSAETTTFNDINFDNEF